MRGGQSAKCMQVGTFKRSLERHLNIAPYLALLTKERNAPLVLTETSQPSTQSGISPEKTITKLVHGRREKALWLNHPPDR